MAPTKTKANDVKQKTCEGELILCQPQRAGELGSIILKIQTGGDFQIT